MSWKRGKEGQNSSLNLALLPGVTWSQRFNLCSDGTAGEEAEWLYARVPKSGDAALARQPEQLG
jgi:hypothetical protein